MADIRDEISPAMVGALAGELSRAWPGFPVDGFTADAAGGLAPLALLDRLRHIAGALRRAMPVELSDGIGVLTRALESATFTGWMTVPCGYWVADRGRDDPATALPALAALTPRLSSEFAIRVFIDRHPEVTFAQLRRWTSHPDPHVRRLVSEGTRPRLPWAARLRGLIADPTPGLDLLDLLYDDESDYVRRSVANHLNDVSKDHAELAVTTAGRWLAVGGAGVRAVVRHGLRTLVKRGHPGALTLLGYPQPAGVAVTALAVTPQRLPIGGVATIRFTLAVAGQEAVPVVIDYAVHHAGARGTRGPKVFKLSTAVLRPGSPYAVTRRHAFREVSVRRLYPGAHRIDICVNGQVLASTSVDLVRPA